MRCSHTHGKNKISAKHTKKQVSLVAQTVKDPPAMQKTQVPSLDQEDPLEEGNSNPFQYSCLKNSMDQGDCCSP